jgi:hypothetical protein
MLWSGTKFVAGTKLKLSMNKVIEIRHAFLFTIAYYRGILFTAAGNCTSLQALDTFCRILSTTTKVLV